MPPEFFDVLQSPIFWILFFPAALLGSLIPAALLKVSMALVFREQVHFGALLMGHVGMAAVFLLMLVLVPDPKLLLALEELLWTRVLLSISSTLLTAVAFSLFIPNDDGEVLGTWKWIVGLIVSWILSVVITFVIAFAWIYLGLPTVVN